MYLSTVGVARNMKRATRTVTWNALPAQILAILSLPIWHLLFPICATSSNGRGLTHLISIPLFHSCLCSKFFICFRLVSTLGGNSMEVNKMATLPGQSRNLKFHTVCESPLSYFELRVTDLTIKDSCSLLSKNVGQSLWFRSNHLERVFLREGGCRVRRLLRLLLLLCVINNFLFLIIWFLVLISAFTTINNRVDKHCIALEKISNDYHNVFISRQLRALEAGQRVADQRFHSHYSFLAKFLIWGGEALK